MQTDAPPDDAQGAEAEREELLPPGEAAKILGVTAGTLGRYARTGIVQFQTLPTGHRRYPRSAVEALRGTPAVDENPDAADVEHDAA